MFRVMKILLMTALVTGCATEIARIRSKGSHTPHEKYLIGRAYYTGNGLAQHREGGIAWLNDAANSGSPDAMNEIGLIYLTDFKPPKCEFAEKYFSMAKTRGHAPASQNLARMYEEGFCSKSHSK